MRHAAEDQVTMLLLSAVSVGGSVIPVMVRVAGPSAANATPTLGPSARTYGPWPLPIARPSAHAGPRR